MTNEPPEPPDLSEELRRLALARIARLRHKNRIRAGHRAARLAGIKRRNIEKMARIKRARESGRDQ